MFCYILLCSVMFCYVLLCSVMFCYILLYSVSSMFCYILQAEAGPELLMARHYFGLAACIEPYNDEATEALRVVEEALRKTEQ